MLIGKRLNQIVLETVAMLALLISTISVNTACWYVLYQEKIPDALDKLRNEIK